MNVCEDEKEENFDEKDDNLKNMPILMIQFIPDVDRADILSVNGKGALSFENRTANSASTGLRSEIFLL